MTSSISVTCCLLSVSVFSVFLCMKGRGPSCCPSVSVLRGSFLSTNRWGLFGELLESPEPGFQELRCSPQNWGTQLEERAQTPPLLPRTEMNFASPVATSWRSWEGPRPSLRGSQGPGRVWQEDVLLLHKVEQCSPSGSSAPDLTLPALANAFPPGRGLGRAPLWQSASGDKSLMTLRRLPFGR